MLYVTRSCTTIKDSTVNFNRNGRRASDRTSRVERAAGSLPLAATAPSAGRWTPSSSLALVCRYIFRLEDSFGSLSGRDGAGRGSRRPVGSPGKGFEVQQWEMQHYRTRRVERCLTGTSTQTNWTEEKSSSTNQSIIIIITTINFIGTALFKT